MKRARSTSPYANAASSSRLRVAVSATSIAACAAWLVVPCAALAGTLDQQQTDGGGGFIGITAASGVAQTFTAGISGGLDQVDLNLEESGNPTDLNVEIRDVSGVPGEVVLASHGVPGTAVPSLAEWVPVSFNSPAVVAAGTQYAIVAYTSGGSLYKWADSVSANPYGGGLAFTAPGSPPSGFWTSQSSDFAFKTYVVPTPPSVPATPPSPPLVPANTGRRAAALKKCKKKHSAKARKRCRKRAKRIPV